MIKALGYFVVVVLLLLLAITVASLEKRSDTTHVVFLRVTPSSMKNSGGILKNVIYMYVVTPFLLSTEAI